MNIFYEIPTFPLEAQRTPVLPTPPGKKRKTINCSGVRLFCASVHGLALGCLLKLEAAHLYLPWFAQLVNNSSCRCGFYTGLMWKFLVFAKMPGLKLPTCLYWPNIRVGVGKEPWCLLPSFAIQSQNADIDASFLPVDLLSQNMEK